jgi:hypothetical protein
MLKPPYRFPGNERELRLFDELSERDQRVVVGIAKLLRVK